MGFFTDAYDLFCISLVTKLLGRIYYHVDGSPTPGILPPQVSSAAPTNTFGLFSKEFLRRHGLHLLGTTTTCAIGWIPKPATMNALEEVFRIARAQTLIALCGTVPGYWFTVALIDVIGRFTIQVLGFFMMTAFMLGLAIPYHHWTTKGNHIGFIHHLHRPGGDLPRAAPFDVPRHIGGFREAGRDRGFLRLPVLGAEPGPGQGRPRLQGRHRGEELALPARRLQPPWARLFLPERAYYTCTSNWKYLYPMITYEQDSDIHHWGFDFLHCDLFSVPPYCGGTSQQDSSFYDTSYVGEGDIDPECATIENDEIIAHALQEELSQLAVAEASGSTHAEDECLQVSVLTQDWFSPYMRSYSPGNEDGQDEADDMEPSSSCSSPGENSYNGDEWSLELTDDFSDIEGEVGKRLNHMVSIPHVPRINGEIPSVDEATSDHQRLIDRLQMYDLIELKVQGDGNCQFRALSDQFYRSPEHHKFVRQQVLNQLKTHPEFYEGYVPMEYGDYLKKLSKSGEWGDHVTLQAAADSYGVKIFVITSFKDTCYIEILPSFQKSKRVIFLSFWAEVHYNSIYPEGDLPALDMKKKKRWWQFGNKY
ncbi:unnamed protein product [Musa hybrid cultivar]